MSQVEIYQSTDKQTQVHVTFEDESIDGTSGTLAPEECTKVVREDTNQGRGKWDQFNSFEDFMVYKDTYQLK